MSFNHFLDELVRPEITIAGRKFNHYHFWVNTGVVVGTVVLFALTWSAAVSLPVMTGIVIMVSLLSLFLFKSTAIFGKSYPFLNWARRGVYHFQILALIFTVTFLVLLKEPVLKYLDILVIAMLIYQAFGRIGCFMAGCCHGRPHSWGVCYGQKHAATRYIYFNQQVRLYPVQAIESAWLFLLTFVTISNLYSAQPDGQNVALYVIGYGLGRFFFEFMRGDLEKKYYLGFSEPQWTAVILSCGVLILELIKILPLHAWHFFAAGSMMLVIIVLNILRVYKPLSFHQVLQPDHIAEVYQTVDWLKQQSMLLPVPVSGMPLSGTTSTGIRISLQDDHSGNNSICLHLSHPKNQLRKSSAKIMARLIMRLGKYEQYQLAERSGGAFELVIEKAVSE